jgi:hypothetical protein
MGTKSDLLQRSAVVGGRDFRKWARKHIAESAFALVMATASVPAAMIIGNNSLASEISNLLVSGVIGPAILLLGGYAVFFLRALFLRHGAKCLG